MSSQSRLMPISYYNPKQFIRLNAYADLILYEQDPSKLLLRAIRFGGEPEMVRALADALYAGAELEVEVGSDKFYFASEPRKFQRQLSHDGLYAEAVLLTLDDEQEIETEEQSEEQQQMPQTPRNCFIFGPVDDRQYLFDEIDRKTTVPLIPAFRDYLLEELQNRKILRKLQTVTIREKLDGWVLKCEKDDANIIAVVEDGLKSGAISIPGTVADPNGFDAITNVTGYLNAFSTIMAERIRNQFTPLYDPAREQLSPEVLSINRYIQEHAGYPLYNAQLAVAEAVMRKLQTGKSAFIVAECGSGKTKIGATAMAALHALKANQMQRGKAKTFNIILCPSHVAKKWCREISETLPDAAGVVVHSITELDQLYTLFLQGDRSIYAVMSKERARDGYMKRPAALYDARHKRYTCPCCDGVIGTVFEDEEVIPSGVEFFRRENRDNHTCIHCGTVLWTAVNPNRRSDWVKLTDYGWVHRNAAKRHLEQELPKSVREKIMELAESPNGYYPTLGAHRKFPLSTYIKRRYKGKIDGLVVDELHEYNNDSGQGEAMGELFAAARKIIGMTATLINGYSSGIFHLLYRTVPHLMQKDSKPYNEPEQFNSEYGVVQSVFEERVVEYASKRRTQRRKTQTKQLPGVSPLVYSRFLLEQAAFLRLTDMGKDLPEYEEIPIPVSMPNEVETEYKRLEKTFVSILRRDPKIKRKIMSAFINLLTVYPDQPYGQEPILHPADKEPLVEPAELGNFDTLGPKEQAVFDLAQKAIANGEKVLVYTSWVRVDSQQKLQKLFVENGYRTAILPATVKTEAREEWVQHQLSKGLQILITNPSLVETGLDLNAFTTLIFYSMGNKLFTLRQASRRSWRINQLVPAVKVYMPYYKHTMQHKALKLMASKLAAAGMIEGNFSEEGLSAMSEIQDMTTQMAKELMLGIQDSVEDLAASFQKMAILHDDEPEETAELQEEPVADVPAAIPIPEIVKDTPTELIDIKKKYTRRKKIEVAEGQLSLFDLVA